MGVASEVDRVGIDLHQLDGIIFIHGHNDHTGRLEYLSESIRDISLYAYAHPAAFAPKHMTAREV